jgi:ribosomal protein L22
MSAEDEQENETPGDTPAEPAAKKPAAKKPAAKKPAAKKPAAKAEKPAESEQPTAEAEKPAPEAEKETTVAAEVAAEAEAPAKKPAKARRAKKAAPVADEQPAAESVAEEDPTKEAAPEPKPAVATKRKPAERRQVVRARARYVRTSARKARMVCGHIRGKSVPEARAILAFTPRDAARDWSKLLESAVANAENNHELLEDDLIVREAYADEGPTIKRFRPRAMGRATPIRKRTSHLTITLTPRS